MATTDRLTYLLEKVRASQASVEDYEELIELIDAEDSGDIVRSMNAFHEAEGKAPMPYDITYWKSVLQEVLAAGKSLDGDVDEVEEPEAVAPVRRLLFWKHYRRWAAVAASIIIIFGAGAYFLFGHKQPIPSGAMSNTAAKNDVPPGGNKAVLTLANGSTILLDSAANGQLAQQGSTKVLKTNNGQLAYHTNNEKPTEVLYNTLATPRGGQYQLMLPDGSKVWLNAASSIRYPTAFSGAYRQVDITGEAYLEIAEDAGRPFTVRVGSPAGAKGEVRVLGTHFNVNAYDDEPSARTTLLEGAVKVTKDAATAVLKPGQQAELEQAGKIRLVPDPDIEQTMAWKNGLFVFNGADIHTIMRQIKRWYNVDVVIDRDIREKFHLEISRNTNVSNVFRILETTGAVHFKIDGKNIQVTQ